MKCLVLVLTCLVLLARARDFDITAKEITDAEGPYEDGPLDKNDDPTDGPVIDGIPASDDNNPIGTDEADEKMPKDTEDPTVLNGGDEPMVPHETEDTTDEKRAFVNGEESAVPAQEFDTAKAEDEILEPMEDVAVHGWRKYEHSWCTVAGRNNNNPLHKQRGHFIDILECKRLCEERPGCTAVEFWEAYNYACFVCTDTSLIEPYTNTNDLAYPVHVWVQEPPTSGPPTTIPSEPEPCDNYNVLDGADRAIGNHDQSNTVCDQSLVEGWYRLEGDAGDEMPTSCVPKNRCGTHAPGWIDGQHPSVLHQTETVKVCYHWSSDCCNWFNDIRVRKCSGYFVYELVKPPVCQLRYCGNKPAPTTEPPTTTPPPPPTKQADPCHGGYQLLDTADRAQGNDDQSHVLCDKNDMVPGWYRISGPAGDRMPEECVPDRRCGTHAPGWLNGSHPSVDDGTVTRQVCYHWTSNCCRWRNDIKVRNCGAFYLYELEKPPVCSLRYCGNAEAPTTQPPVTTVSTETPPPEIDVCYDYTVLDEPSRAMGNKDQSNLQCDRNSLTPDWYRFEGHSGERIPEVCVPMNRCGTHAPGWLNGSHPTLEGETVTREVCYHWNNDCCHWKNNVRVRKCHGYYVYELEKPPVCHLRYCGDFDAPVSTPQPTHPTHHVTTGTGHPPPHPAVNLTCGKDEMTISIPKYLLHGLDAEHLRLNDVNCGATETETNFIFHTPTVGARACGTKMRVTKGANGFVCYTNNVLEIPLEHHQIITRVREVEIPFFCYYSKWGVVSSVGLEVKSKKIVFSKKGNGKFEMSLEVSPDESHHPNYKKKDFPVAIALRTILYVEVSVDTEDDRLEILAEHCFATPYADPFKDVGKWRYDLIKDGCAVDDTLEFIESNDPASQQFKLEAFNFIGDHQFVYMHCKVKVCNRTDPHSRCAQGCIRHPAAVKRRSLEVAESKDEEYHLAQGPFMRRDVEEEDTDMKETVSGVRDMESRGQNTAISVALATVAAVCLLGVSYFMWDKRKRAGRRVYQPLNIEAEE